jgi:hypothetical protein
MALPDISKTLNNLNTSTLVDNYSTTVTDNIFKTHPLWEMLNSKGSTYDGGPKLMWPVLYDTLDGFFYHGQSEYETEDKEFMTMAQAYPAYCGVPVMITQTDVLENSGRSQIIDLLETKFRVAEDSMEEKLSDGIWGTYARTNGVANLWGLTDIVKTTAGSDPSGGAYGEIAVSGNSWWQNLTSASGVSDGGLTTALVQASYGLVAKNGSKKYKPTIGVTTQAIWNTLWAKADSAQRNGTEMMKKFGMTDINWNGTPIIVDENAPDHQLRWLNTNYLFLKTHAQANFAWTPFFWHQKKMAYMKVLYWAGQLCCSQRRRQCVMTTTG